MLSCNCPSLRIRSKSLAGHNAGNIVRFDADPRRDIMFAVRCLLGMGALDISGWIFPKGVLQKSGDDMPGNCE